MNEQYYGSGNDSGNRLKHYGVLGMKWGVRKNPSRAFGKASTKARNLSRKADRQMAVGTKLEYKSAKYRMKSNKKATRALVNPMAQEKANSLARKADKKLARGKKLQAKSAKSRNKRSKWIRHMEHAFRDIPISRIEEPDLEKGREFVYMLKKG